MRQSLIILAVLVTLVLAQPVSAQCANCVYSGSPPKGRCTSTSTGFDLCTTLTPTTCSVAGGNPCPSSGGGGTSCYWDGTEWVCECSDVAGVKPDDCAEVAKVSIRAKKLWVVLKSGVWDGQTVYLALCAPRVRSLLTQYQKNLSFTKDKNGLEATLKSENGGTITIVFLTP